MLYQVLELIDTRRIADIVNYLKKTFITKSDI